MDAQEQMRRMLKANEDAALQEYMRRMGAKEFADRLAAVRKKDALALVENAKTSISGQSEDKARAILCRMACEKLIEVGYKEFGELFKEKLDD